MALWTHVFLCAAALCGSILSNYVEVDKFVFQEYGGGQQQFSSTGTQFKEAIQVTLPNGKVKEKLQQYHDGLRVLNTGVVATVTEHGLEEVRGSMFKIGVEDEQVMRRHSMNPVDPLEVAKSSVRAKRGVKELHIEPGTESVEEVVLPSENGHALKVFEVKFFIEALISRPHFIIDASTGAILEEWEGLDTAGTLVNGGGPGGNEKTGRYQYGSDGKYGSLVVNKTGNRCKMENDIVKTVDMNHTSWGVTDAFEYDCGPNNENTHKYVNGAYSPLNDASYFGKVLYDMYRDWIQTTPLTFKLGIRVHYKTNYQNAFWNGRELTFGDGRDRFYPLVDINVVTHEAAHGFTEQNSGLVYRYMSGGMNEAYSDIAGEAAEMYMKGKVDWLVGGDIFKTAGKGLRYFEKPSMDGVSLDHLSQFKGYKDVHHSSGLFNRAFYVIANSPGWSIKTAFQVFTKANQLYWTEMSTFVEGACGVKMAAIDFGLDLTAIARGFTDVGIDVCGLSTAPPPITLPPPSPPPFGNGKADCDFELDVCDWLTPNNKYNVSWTRHSGPTREKPNGERYCGPSKAFKGSYYIYLDGGLGPDENYRSGIQTLLKSKRFSAASTRCLKFAYIMYGAFIGALRVELVHVDNSTSGSQTRKLLFNWVGNKGDAWFRATKDVEMQSGAWLEITGVKGKSWAGDIAIDDVTLTEGSCPVEPTYPPPTKPCKNAVSWCSLKSKSWCKKFENFRKVNCPKFCGTCVPTTEKPTVAGGCNFDKVSMCEWTAPLNKRKRFWEIHQGKTSSKNTGPSQDVSGKGYYVYMEASNTNGFQGDQFFLNSPVLDAGSRCMTFYYHMFGKMMGSLQVYVIVGNTKTAIYQRVGNYGKGWKHHSLTIESKQSHQVEFIGTIGRDSSGDIALDEIKFVDGACDGAQ